MVHWEALPAHLAQGLDRFDGGFRGLRLAVLADQRKVNILFFLNKDALRYLICAELILDLL